MSSSALAKIMDVFPINGSNEGLVQFPGDVMSDAVDMFDILNPFGFLNRIPKVFRHVLQRRLPSIMLCAAF